MPPGESKLMPLFMLFLASDYLYICICWCPGDGLGSIGASTLYFMLNKFLIALKRLVHIEYGCS